MVAQSLVAMGYSFGVQDQVASGQAVLLKMLVHTTQQVLDKICGTLRKGNYELETPARSPLLLVK